jgi:hypothetical protein
VGSHPLDVQERSEERVRRPKSGRSSEHRRNDHERRRRDTGSAKRHQCKRAYERAGTCDDTKGRYPLERQAPTSVVEFGRSSLHELRRGEHHHNPDGGVERPIAE